MTRFNSESDNWLFYLDKERRYELVGMMRKKYGAFREFRKAVLLLRLAIKNDVKKLLNFLRRKHGQNTKI